MQMSTKFVYIRGMRCMEDTRQEIEGQVYSTFVFNSSMSKEDFYTRFLTCANMSSAQKLVALTRVNESEEGGIDDAFLINHSWSDLFEFVTELRRRIREREELNLDIADDLAASCVHRVDEVRAQRAIVVVVGFYIPTRHSDVK